MPDPKDILGSISGGHVLDVATGSGGFIHFLLAGLCDYSEIIGVDANPRVAEAFATAFKDHPAIRFVQMDAHNLDFAPAAFDTVCISNSLHHFEHPSHILQQMKRVLRPGGRLILAEMYCDGQTETQLTHVHLHHWWAAVDRAVGDHIHFETYSRQELIDLFNTQELEEVSLFDISDTTEDPKAPEVIAELEAVIDRYIQRASAHPELQSRGEALRRRVHQIGFHSATTVVAVGRKPVV
jgi:ubiquinone/menaquinone biosynthesis C-methylase UbiE